MEEKCLRLDRLFRDLKHYVCLYPLSYIVTPTTERDHKNCTCDVIDFIAYVKTEKNPRKSTTRGRACFDKVVRPRQDILEQKSTVIAQNICPKIRRDKRCCKAAILATGQRLSFILIVMQTLSLSYQSRVDIFRAALHPRSHCLFALHFH